MKNQGEIKKYKLKHKSEVRNNIILKIIAIKFETDSEAFGKSFLTEKAFLRAKERDFPNGISASGTSDPFRLHRDAVCSDDRIKVIELSPKYMSNSFSYKK